MRWITLLLCAALAGPAVAEIIPVPGLYNTGVDDHGAVIADGQIDPHYGLLLSADAQFPGPATFAANPIPFGYWVGNSGSSRWIAPSANEGYPGSPPHPDGTYIYRLSFNLIDIDPATVTISGSFAADNSATVRINGQTTTGVANDFYGLYGFTITSGFHPGNNQLDFVVVNAPSAGSNPTGVRVDGLTGSGQRIGVGVGVDPGPAGALALAAAPNPASRRTTLSCAIPRAGHVRLSIRNVAGRGVRLLVDRELAAGRTDVVWDGITEGGALAPAGIYFVVLEGPGGTARRRLAWLP